MIVGGLDRHEMIVPTGAVHEMHDAPSRLAGGDAEFHVAPFDQHLHEIQRAFKERIEERRIIAHFVPRGPVRLRQIFGRRILAGECGESFDEREANDRQRPLALWCRQTVCRKGAPLRLDDKVLAVDERAVDIEQDEMCRAHASGAPSIGSYCLASKPNFSKLFRMCGGSGAVTSSVAPRGCGKTRRRARRCSLRSTSSGTARMGSRRRCSSCRACPYFGSPIIGWPIASACARS